MQQSKHVLVFYFADKLSLYVNTWEYPVQTDLLYLIVFYISSFKYYYFIRYSQKIHGFEVLLRKVVPFVTNARFSYLKYGFSRTHENIYHIIVDLNMFTFIALQYCCKVQFSNHVHFRSNWSILMFIFIAIVHILILKSTCLLELRKQLT